MNALPTRPLGRTGRTVTTLGLGGAFLSADSHAQGVAAIRHAIDRGITYFDTSPMYGDNQSQPILGEALSQAGPAADGIVLATKLGYLPQPGDHRDPKALWAQLEDNLRRLGRDHVDVLQIHEADMAHWWTGGPPARAMAGLPRRASPPPPGRIDPHFQNDAYDFEDSPVNHVLRQAIEQGKARHWGITGNDAAAMERVLRELAGTIPDTMLLAFNYDLLHRQSLVHALPLAAEQGVACLLGGVLQCGQLVDPHPEWLESPPNWMTPELSRAYRKLLAIQRESGLSLVELTLRYLLPDERRAASILVGAKTAGEVEANVRIFEKGPLPRDVYRQLDDLVEPRAKAQA